MFEKLWQQIESASEKKLPRVISEVAEQYDDMMLEYSVIPNEGVEFLVQVFSSDRVLHAKGIEHFLLEINVDFCKYSLEQRTKLLNTLIKNAGAVSDELGRHSIGDFIARAFPRELAFQTFFTLSAGTGLEKHVAFVGLDVLRMREDKESDFYKNIEIKWREMLSQKTDGHA